MILNKLDEAWERYFDKRHPKHKYIVKRFNWIIDRVCGERLLDVGCSNGLGSYLASFKIKKVYGIDICEEIIAKAKVNNKERDNVILSIGDAENLLFNDNYFDCIIMGEVLEHVNDDRKAISEAYRVLRDEGTIIITIPEGGGLSVNHLREYNKQSISDLLSNFKIEEIGRIKTSKKDTGIIIKAKKIINN